MSATTQVEPHLSAQRSALSAQRSALSAQRSALGTRPSAFAVVRVVLGLLLIAAAILKLSGLNVTALPRVGWFSSPQVQVLAAEWELVLGLWLISGACPFWSWLAAVGTFSIFAIISGYFGWIGVASCGCFGAIKASPWVVFGVDIAAFCVLAISRPLPGDSSARSDSKLTHTSRLIAFSVATGLLIVLIHFTHTPTTTGADLLSVHPGVLHFGKVAQSGQAQTSIRITNNSHSAIRVVRIETSCDCFSIELENAIVEPGSEIKAVAKLDLAHEPAFAGKLLVDATGYEQGQNRPIAFRIEATAEVASKP